MTGRRNRRGHGTPEGVQRTAKARAAAAEKRQQAALEEHLHIYGQVLANMPSHEIKKRDGSPASDWLRRAAVRNIRSRVGDLTGEENLTVAIESSKVEIQELRQRLKAFMEDEETRIVVGLEGANGTPQEPATVREQSRPNRNAEIGLRKLIADKERHLHELMGLLEVHRSANRLYLDPEGMIDLHRLIMSVVAEFLPETERQIEFEQRLATRFRELQKGRMSHVEELRALSDGRETTVTVRPE